MTRTRFAIFCAVLVFQSITCAEDIDQKQSGPLELVIQYKCLPGNRAELRNKVTADDLPRFEKWRQEGILLRYELLFSRYADGNSWDMLAHITFPNYANLSRWKRIERTFPAGLSAGALQLVSSVETFPADQLRTGAAGETSSEPVFFVIPYTISVPPATYLEYADSYVKPQFAGWIREGVLSSYQVLLQRYTAARPWDVLIILRYASDESFGQREKIIAKVREELKSNPQWKAASDSKLNLRVERLAIIADSLGGLK